MKISFVFQHKGVFFFYDKSTNCGCSQWLGYIKLMTELSSVPPGGRRGIKGCAYLHTGWHMNNRAPKAHKNNWRYVITRECRTVKPIFRKANTINIHLFVYFSPPCEKRRQTASLRDASRPQNGTDTGANTRMLSVWQAEPITRAPPPFPPSLPPSCVNCQTLSSPT